MTDRLIVVNGLLAAAQPDLLNSLAAYLNDRADAWR